ncbi:hypothetical protein HMPREF0813_01239 [Streptococcus anginosus F0211]|uniref:Uncharacterized protein n=1 Tax=Streptococcus anginosus F0211 TaxID=706437 RepID=E6J1W1_STRAP|nr:hypothetical protein HMPREF0813_01239 [Streptococcus anginosus F0211]
MMNLLSLPSKSSFRNLASRFVSVLPSFLAKLDISLILYQS